MYAITYDGEIVQAGYTDEDDAWLTADLEYDDFDKIDVIEVDE